jgi:hypothetical protein
MDAGVVLDSVRSCKHSAWASRLALVMVSSERMRDAGANARRRRIGHGANAIMAISGTTLNPLDAQTATLSYEVVDHVLIFHQTRWRAICVRNRASVAFSRRRARIVAQRANRGARNSCGRSDAR